MDNNIGYRVFLQKENEINLCAGTAWYPAEPINKNEYYTSMKTKIEKCEYCGSKMSYDSHGCCSSCGAPVK